MYFFQLYIYYLCLILISVLSSNTNTNPNTNPYISWMHIQKTSSWLGQFILDRYCIISNHTNNTNTNNINIQLPYNVTESSIHYSCSIETYPQFGYHYPYNLQNNKIRNHTILTLFRKPINRLISAFLFDKGGMLPAGFPNREKSTHIIHQHILNSKHPIVTYSKYHGISSCQYKMLYGYWCGENINLTIINPNPNSKYSKNHIRKKLQTEFIGFGLTEEYEASNKLIQILLNKQYNTNKYSIEKLINKKKKKKLYNI